MKVLHLISVLAPSGAEQSLVAMAPVLSALGVELEVAYLHERPGAERFLADAGLEVTSLSGAGGTVDRLRRTVALVRSRRPDLIHTSLTEANLLGRTVGTVLRVPVVSSLVNVTYGPEQLQAPDRSRRGVRARHLADMATARLVVRFHAVTTLVADVMAPRLHIPRSRIEVVPRGRSAEALGRRTAQRRDCVREALGFGPDDDLILAAARQEYQKGLDVLLEAMPAVVAARPRARLVVAGRPGLHTPVLEETVARCGLGDRVVFLGLRHDVPDLLSAADLFVLPSRWEGMGGVLLEAMALEAPIVASDLPTLREALPDEGYARFTPLERPGPMAEAMLATLADPDDAASRATRSRQRFVDHFTVERVAEAMRAFYSRALGSS